MKRKAYRPMLVSAVTIALAVLFLSTLPVQAAGLLKQAGTGNELAIRTHAVDVTINNGFARTVVDQVFANSSDQPAEAVYTFPLPKQASLSELSLWIDGREVLGEVVEKKRAKELYEKEKSQGRQTALASKDDFKTFNIAVGNIPARADARVRLVYYQPLEIDLNVGRYLYPLAEGNVDEERLSGFWAVDDTVTGTFSFNLTLKSAFPIRDVRLPGLETQATITKLGGNGDDGPAIHVGGAMEEVYQVSLTAGEGGGSLGDDIILYYRLDDAVPARLEVVPYRDSESGGPGTFMAVLTPAASLQPIAGGNDWVFVLDVSGSMQGHKIATLADGVKQMIGMMKPGDRFRIVTFNNDARDLTGGFVRATPENVNTWLERVKGLHSEGGTALHAGLAKGLKRLDEGRTTALILVTDAVCNIGPSQHKHFVELMEEHDIRLFTFVIGNSANQPLVDRLTKESGGFSMNLSDRDDIAGRLIQARAKALNEAMVDAELTFKGGKVTGVTPAAPGNLYLGQQLVVFGQYEKGGRFQATFRAKIAGEDREWKTEIVLPETDLDNPEIERLWALSAIEETLQQIRDRGESEGRVARVVNLGVDYSLVTDYTSMVVVSDQTMEEENIARNNADRVNRERGAQQARTNQPPKTYRADTQVAQTSPSRGDSGQQRSTGMFGGQSSAGLGSGPVGLPFLAGAEWLRRRRKKKNREGGDERRAS